MAQRRQKVLFIVTKSNWGGAQKYVFDLATRLPKDLYEAVVLCGVAEGTSSAGVLVERLTQSGVRVIFTPTLGRDVSRSDFAGYRAIARAITAERPVIVHLNSSKAGGLGALAARIHRVPRIVFTAHGLAYDEPRSPLARGFIFALTWLTFVLSHAVIVISRDNESRARALPWCRQRIHLVYNGCEPFDVVPRIEARRFLGAKAPEMPDTVWLGTIAELVPNKGIEVLLEAAVGLKAAGHRFCLLIVGVGDLEPRLNAFIAQHRIAHEVRLLGYVPHAARYLSALDVFVLASHKEGLPYVLLEAGIASLPCVGSDIGGIRDILEGDAGILVPRNDPKALADALGALILDASRRRELGDALHARVSSTFTMATMLSETIAVYRALA